ncbi:hypothetical protein CN526_27100 [Bacillus wiedmannii]|uniref:Uncharacterized protein n=1 Tax=Bacillus wiedmannii TaxID=1890302 RepID=A0A2A8MTN1_9BACI|nr:hypothetical protein [Bacillus wiedmannii]PEU21350.1 hypothetical protein CN526_27100 [Bacillus wiedmannii]PFZ19536.1 hypothetical protein COL66_29265 [Bacillus wiedmannii]
MEGIWMDVKLEGELIVSGWHRTLDKALVIYDNLGLDDYSKVSVHIYYDHNDWIAANDKENGGVAKMKPIKSEHFEEVVISYTSGLPNQIKLEVFNTDDEPETDDNRSFFTWVSVSEAKRMRKQLKKLIKQAEGEEN